jgi:hypothetical protein
MFNRDGKDIALCSRCELTGDLYLHLLLDDDTAVAEAKTYVEYDPLILFAYGYFRQETEKRNELLAEGDNE